MHGSLRAYLTALLESRRQGGRMKLVFQGGPMDGDERAGDGKHPQHTVVVESQVLKGAAGGPMRATYELVRLEYPSQTATYRFSGWHETSPP
jgi:hypothetical protein